MLEMAAKLEHENVLLSERCINLDSAMSNVKKQVKELQLANKADNQALVASRESIDTMAKEIRYQKKLKLLFGGVAILVLILDHAR